MLDERQRMAREIHDTIAQGLTGIVTQLEAAEQARDRPEAWQRHVRNAIGLARESLSEARRSVEGSRPEHLETARLPEALAEVAREWSELNGVPGRGRHHGRRPAAPPRGRGGAAADRPGGAGQRRQARQRLARLADAVLHGRRRDARRAGRRRRLRRPDRVRRARVRLRAVGDAAAGEPGGRDAGHRVRAGRRHGRLGTGARRSWRPAWSAGHDADPPPHRRRPPGRARRPARDVLGRPRVRRRRRGLRRRRGDRARGPAGPGRDPDGPPDARRQRRGRHPRARRAADPVARAGADDLRLGQRRRAGHRGRGDRLPPQGLAARRAVPRGARRLPRRVGARLVGRHAADEPAPRPGHRTRSATASSRCCR